MLLDQLLPTPLPRPRLPLPLLLRLGLQAPRNTGLRQQLHRLLRPQWPRLRLPLHCLRLLRPRLAQTLFTQKEQYYQQILGVDKGQVLIEYISTIKNIRSVIRLEQLHLFPLFASKLVIGRF